MQQGTTFATKLVMMEFVSLEPEEWKMSIVVQEDTKAGEGLEGMSSEERLRTWGLSSLERRRPRGDLTALYSFLRRGRGEGGADLFSLVPTARTRGNGSKLCPSGEVQT
ncbi:hypothetical protein QYF61_019838 [Mycteria americana]|uniref:Uncharacterized protein n=1 Tax=Mycteria americana TaxID=33587 RepID=A0AAN7SGN7_MYCAM|nr:hypothetical protein QYF61_019838 [Mycteria americana]